MRLTTEPRNDLLLITVHSSRIDASAAIQFKDQMREMTRDGAARIILDLNQVGFIDSSGLGAIVASMKQLAPGQVLELAALSPTVAKVFRLTRMDSVFTLHENITDAFKEMPKAG